MPDGDIKLRPRTFGTTDIDELTGGADLFARKFDSAEDVGIFALLERHLLTRQASRYVAPALPLALEYRALAR